MAETDPAKVYCEDCDAWLVAETRDDCVECDCGQRFVVTVTPVPPVNV
jgi:hypothetical protein